MRKKLFLLIIIVFLLTGCTNEYNITFSNDKVEEKIISTIPIQDIPTQTQAEIIAGIELDDRVTPFIEGEQYPFINDEKIKYNKTVTKDGTTSIVTLDYTYTHDEYKKSMVYNTCFQTKNFLENKDDYTLNFSGKFYCYYGDELVINIKTNNEVLYNNADNVDGNVYTWIVNNDNFQNLNISMQISKKSAMVTPIIMFILAIVGIVLIIGGLIAYKNIKNREAVNEI